MEALGLTEEQRGIVAERGRDVIVTAGAGSGKTRTLVERYLSLLGDHRIPEIAAVTFTDAAAAEMRDRVRREVLARPELTRHRADLDQAAIGTIHSLCSQILREHPVEAEIDPAARVLSDDEAEFETITACVDALEAAADADDYRALALREIGVFALTNRLPQMVARRDEVANAYEALPGSAPASWAEHVRTLLDSMCGEAVEEARPRLAEWASWLKSAHAGPGEDALSERLADALASLGDPAQGGWKALLDRAIDAGEKIKLQGGRAENWAYPLEEVKDKLRRLRDAARRLEKIPRWNEHDGVALEALASLQRLFEDACARYAARKREMAALDYLDLEVEAARMLRSHPGGAEEYRSRFRHLMVDELQDTNPSQIALLDLLSDGGGASPGPERFFVGDVKQAIYRFRGSDVRHFTRLLREIEARGAVHALARSFRAHDSLVQTLNVLFHAVFGEPREEYEAPMQKMTGRGPGPPALPHLVVLPVSDQTPQGARTADVDRRRVEADAVAAEAASLLKGGVDVWDRGAARLRPARASDIAVLLRRLTNVHLFEQALESRGVPYRTPAGAGFFTRQEVLDLTNLLGWLAEPDDAVALAGALRSPLFMIDDQSLLALRSAGPDLVKALRDPPEGVLREARPFCQRAAEVLDELRRAAPFSAPDALLESALALTGFEASWAPLQGGGQALANIRKLVGLARTLSDHSLDQLVTYLRRRRDELAAREGQAVLDESDAVRLLTVHGAKGLEFPIVFVPEAHLPSRGSYEAVSWRAEEGISLTLARETGAAGSRRRPGFYSYLLTRDQAEEAAEHKRLFYVAATRAADRLYLSGDEAGRGDGWLGSALDAIGTVGPEGVEIRPSIPVDLNAISRRPAPAAVAVPSEDEERELMPALVARPRVIPLRSSTPVTALRDPAARRAFGRHGDGLGLLRGSLAHRAIEVWFTTGERPSLVPLAGTLDDGVDERDAARLASEVDAMLNRLDVSPLAATLREPGTRVFFELPFSWDWDGAPVHGTIDLAYESGDAWRVIDFKTDDVRNGALVEAAAPYLPQLALYAAALERATGRRPEAGLLFLRTGDCYTPADGELDEALAAARARIDAGQALETPASSELDESLWDSRRI